MRCLFVLLQLSQIRGARILIATEKRWGPVNNYWEEALAKSALEQVGEEVCENTVVLSHLDNINAIFSPRLRGSGQTYRESSQKRRSCSQVVMETPARLPRPVVMFELQAKEDDTA